MNPIPAVETQPEIIFPIMGLDSSSEVSLQPQNTSRSASNVRTFDKFQECGRGGSRPGMVKLIPDQAIGNNPIQDLNVVVWVNPDATLPDDDSVGVPGDDLVPDPSSNNLRRRRQPGYLIRRHGSGVQPNRNKKSNKPSSPIAVDDYFYLNQGDTLSAMDLLGNDTYLGVPDISLGVVPSLDGGTFNLTGSGTATRGVFVAGTSASDVKTYKIPYRLMASGNVGTSSANIIVTVFKEFPPSSYPQTYTGTATNVASGDGYADFTPLPGSGLPAGIIHVTANGAGSGEDGATNIFISNFNEISGLVNNSNFSVKLTGTFDTGYSGVFQVL